MLKFRKDVGQNLVCVVLPPQAAKDVARLVPLFGPVAQLNGILEADEGGYLG